MKEEKDNQDLKITSCQDESQHEEEPKYLNKQNDCTYDSNPSESDQQTKENQFQSISKFTSNTDNQNDEKNYQNIHGQINEQNNQILETKIDEQSFVKSQTQNNELQDYETASNMTQMLKINDKICQKMQINELKINDDNQNEQMKVIDDTISQMTTMQIIDDTVSQTTFMQRIDGSNISQLSKVQRINKIRAENLQMNIRNDKTLMQGQNIDQKDVDNDIKEIIDEQTQNQDAESSQIERKIEIQDYDSESDSNSQYNRFAGNLDQTQELNISLINLNKNDIQQENKFNRLGTMQISKNIDQEEDESFLDQQQEPKLGTGPIQIFRKSLINDSSPQKIVEINEISSQEKSNSTNNGNENNQNQEKFDSTNGRNQNCQSINKNQTQSNKLQKDEEQIQNLMREWRQKEQEAQANQDSNQQNIEEISWLFKYYELMTQEEKQMKSQVKQRSDKILNEKDFKSQKLQ